MSDEIINFSEETHRAAGAVINNVIVNQALPVEDANAYIAALAYDVRGTEAEFTRHEAEHVAEMALKVLQMLKGETLTYGMAASRYGEKLRTAFMVAELERREGGVAAFTPLRQNSLKP